MPAKVWKADVPQMAQEADCPSTVPVPRPVWKDEPHSGTLQRGLAFHTLAETRSARLAGIKQATYSDVFSTRPTASLYFRDTGRLALPTETASASADEI